MLTRVFHLRVFTWHSRCGADKDIRRPTGRKARLNSNFEQVQTEYKCGKRYFDTVHGVQLKSNLEHTET